MPEEIDSVGVVDQKLLAKHLAPGNGVSVASLRESAPLQVALLHARRQQHELREIATVQRQVAQLRRFDKGSHR
jgi:hypothetical protein